ncbi:MAG: hypothetical protein IH840_05060 [Candidatus Heimdallarchaeota archaeon]|nr:hypothetical protein [Candidatus Heimdallarchaeota archaeon]
MLSGEWALQFHKGEYQLLHDRLILSKRRNMTEQMVWIRSLIRLGRKDEVLVYLDEMMTKPHLSQFDKIGVLGVWLEASNQFDLTDGIDFILNWGKKILEELDHNDPNLEFNFALFKREVGKYHSGSQFASVIPLHRRSPV